MWESSLGFVENFNQINRWCQEKPSKNDRVGCLVSHEDYRATPQTKIRQNWLVSLVGSWSLSDCQPHIACLCQTSHIYRYHFFYKSGLSMTQHSNRIDKCFNFSSLLTSVSHMTAYFKSLVRSVSSSQLLTNFLSSRPCRIFVFLFIHSRWT